MVAYEVTLTYPDLDFDEHRRFLGSVAASRPSGLDGFRRHGSGVALTFVVETAMGPDFARQLALHRAAGLWPNFRPASSTPDVAGGTTGGEPGVEPGGDTGGST